MTAIFGCVPFYQAYSSGSLLSLLSVIMDSDSESKYITRHINLATWVIFSAVKNPTSSCKRPLWPFYWRQMRSFGPWYDVSSRYVNDIRHYFLPAQSNPFNSPSRMAYFQTPWLDIEQRTPHLQKSRTQILPPISPNGGRTLERRWNQNPKWSFGIEHEENRDYYDTTTSLSFYRN